jgi:RNA polymerase sigma-70 factor (ECF subfamily)
MTASPTPAEPNDQELVRRTQAGDPGAFDQLVLRYESRMRVTIYGVLLNHEDTEDALVETFFKAYRNLSSFQGKSEFSTWLYRIAKNTALNALRKLRRRPQGVVPLVGEEGFNEGKWFIDESLSSDTRRQLENKELQNKLNECLALLSEDHRTVVTLFDIQELSHAEIAKIMGCSEGTVRSRLFYAHKQLQSQLQRYLRSQ